MTSLSLNKPFLLGSASMLLLASTFAARADFIDDGTANFGLRNHYMNQNPRHNQERILDEWSQAFILNYQSGYTEGKIGFGLDLYAATAVKLDSGVDRSPNSFPQLSNGKSRDQFSKLGGGFKTKFSNTELKVGGLMPRLPVLQANLQGRILPQIFTGALLTSNEINGLTATFGHINRVNQRNSVSRQEMQVNILGKRLIDKNTNQVITGGTRGNFTSNALDLAHFNYKWNDELSTSYSFGRLKDLYQQHIFNLVHILPLDEKQSLKTDLRMAHSKSDGDVYIDNNAFSGMLTYQYGSHKLGLGFQKMMGDTGYAYVQGADPFLVNYVANREFGAKDETSWQIRHDYNFASIGVPGLTMINRYIKGTGADLGGATEGREWERDFDITYAPQKGALKNLSIRWRNSTVRSNINKDLDDNRIIVSYTLPLK